MSTIMKPHARMRMRDRDITKEQVHMILRDPAEIITVGCGRFAVYRKLKGKELVEVHHHARGVNITILTSVHPRILDEWLSENDKRSYNK